MWQITAKPFYHIGEAVLLASCHHGHNLRISCQLWRDGQLPEESIHASTCHSHGVHHNVQPRPQSKYLNGGGCVSSRGSGPIAPISHHLPVIVPFSNYTFSKEIDWGFMDNVFPLFCFKIVNFYTVSSTLGLNLYKYFHNTKIERTKIYRTPLQSKSK